MKWDSLSLKIGFSKENSFYFMKRLKRKDLLLLETKLTEKIPDPCNVKEHNDSFLRKKKSKIINQQWKTFENPNIVDIKLVILEHPKISHESSKNIRQVEKVSQAGTNSSYIVIQKNVKIFWTDYVKRQCQYMLLKVMEVLIMLKF